MAGQRGDVWVLLAAPSSDESVMLVRCVWSNSETSQYSDGHTHLPHACMLNMGVYQGRMGTCTRCAILQPPSNDHIKTMSMQ